MPKLTTICLLLAAILPCVTSCGTVGEAVNPYKSKFNCAFTDKGKCTDMTNAYNESVQSRTGQNTKNGDEGKKDSHGTTGQEAVYQDSLFKKLTGLIEEATTPMIATPKVMRVLLLPYKGTDKELFMHRYVYFVVDDYSWVLGDSIGTGEN